QGCAAGIRSVCCRQPIDLPERPGAGGVARLHGTQRGAGAALHPRLAASRQRLNADRGILVTVSVPRERDEEKRLSVATNDTKGGTGDLVMSSLTKTFGPFTAVDDLSLTIPQGSFFALLGPSGCGKTTTLRMVAGLEQPTGGAIHIGGTDITGTKPYQRPVNTVFQSYALFPHMTVWDNVAFGL